MDFFMRRRHNQGAVKWVLEPDGAFGYSGIWHRAKDLDGDELWCGKEIGGSPIIHGPDSDWYRDGTHCKDCLNRRSEAGEGLTGEVSELEWKRIERRIYSPFWRAIHNLFAHPMLAIYRPWGERLHEWTAEKMYRQRGDKPPIITDAD